MNDITDNRRWYAIYVRSRYEKKVHSTLSNRGIESFLPLIEEVRTWSDRRKRVQMPLFPGYVLVNVSLARKFEILSADGVVRFVGIDQSPSVIPAEQIDWIRIIAGSGEQVKREECIHIGQQVSVIAGPFKGVKGFISQIKGLTRVVIVLEFVSHAISVEVSPHYVEAISESIGSHSVSVAA